MVRMETKKRYLKNEEEQGYFAKRFSIENEIIKKSSTIISLSETEKQNLNRFYGCPIEKITVIPGGVNLKQFRPVEKEKARRITNFLKNDFIVLFVGRLEWRKGIGTLISATRLLKGEIPNLKTIIVGGKIYGKQKNIKDFKEYQRLSEKTKEEGVKDMVQFIGRVDEGRLPFFYSAADVFVIPSYYEPFGLVTLEGMASKIPVVASNVGGLSTTIKDGKTGLLFEPRNALDLKEKILLLYKSKEFVYNLVENGYNEIIKHYSWKNIASKVDEVYKSLFLKLKP
jgi:glycosyltransferase involved in cell wall biosynthesis